MHIIAAIVFAFAIAHTLAAPALETLAEQYPKHAVAMRLLGTIELVFSLWGCVLIACLALSSSPSDAYHYLTTRQYTEPLFVFVIMVIAASRPILDTVTHLIDAIVKRLPADPTLITIWLSLTLVPLLGSYITEPAAMTIAALLLAPLIFKQRANQNMPEWLKYVSLAVIFVNVSIGGTLSAYAAPPVLMVAKQWGWTSTFMAQHFGWKAAIAVFINASIISYLLRNYIKPVTVDTTNQVVKQPYSVLVSLIHITVLTSVVYFAHVPLIFIGLFLLFYTFSKATKAYQSPLLIKEGLLVGIFLAGLVILGGMQQWWLEPIVSDLAPLPLFIGTTALTGIVDNAALTFLGAQIQGLSDATKYMLMAGAVTGGGLTIIANAPNPAGASLLRQHFHSHTIHHGYLFLAALPPTIVAAIVFLL